MISVISSITSPSVKVSGSDPFLSTNLTPPQKSQPTSSQVKLKTLSLLKYDPVKLMHDWGANPTEVPKEELVPPPH